MDISPNDALVALKNYVTIMPERTFEQIERIFDKSTSDVTQVTKDIQVIPQSSLV